ncbi:MAG: 50S ribosomal protein L29 [Psychroflexus sp.]|jgi:large subunit ribosomal protein L29|nr:50S ribosomal protein L29 [Psychroflexus sp.]MDR9447668.1 50S ribosomal protein L29 [Psychroflexus sp.]
MKKSEIKTSSYQELQEALEKAKKDYKNLKLTHAVSPLENPSEIKTLRRSIARINTELTLKSAE